jgi:serine/threonine protein kinase
MKGLNHPNIIDVKAVYHDSHRTCIVMEKCEGGDLFDAVQERRFRTERQLAGVVRQILKGLEYLHDLGIVHSDIKLANILLGDTSAEPVVKIIDFGVSQFVPESGLQGIQVGSPSFMAPEVLLGDYNQLADMWSLGVVVFIMLFGFNPFNPKAKNPLKYRSRINAHIVKGFSKDTKAGRGAFFPETIPASDSAKDFVAKLLESSVSDRLSAKEALSHPWITNLV